MYRNLTRAGLVEKWAEEVFKTHSSITGCAIALPVPIVDIAEAVFGLRCDVIRMTDQNRDLSGVLLPAHERIIVNENCPPGRLAFTIAHEIAHWVVDCRMGNKHHYLNWISDICGQQKTEQEAWANHIASSLLMPRSQLDAKLEDYVKLDDIDLELLANEFGVTEKALIVRLRTCQLGIKAVSVRVGNGSRIDNHNHSVIKQNRTMYHDDSWKMRFMPWLPSAHYSLGGDDSILLLGDFGIIDTRLLRQIRDIKERVNKLFIVSLENSQSVVFAAELSDVDGVVNFSSDVNIQHQLTMLEKALGNNVRIVILPSDPWLQSGTLFSGSNDLNKISTNFWS